MEEKEFNRLLKTSRLRLTESEARAIKKDIDKIIGYFDKIEEINAREKPAYQPINVPTRMRKDTVNAFKDTNSLKKRSKMYGDYIIGPKL